MLYQIISFLLEVAATLVGGACLLRLYMGWRRMSMQNPVGRFVLALTDWLVLPLRRLLPPRGSLDAASLLGAWLVKLLQFIVMMLLLGGHSWAVLPVLALLGIFKLAISVATSVVLVSVLLSWTQSRSPIGDVFDRLSAPLLAPLRRIIPLIGGIDLSPLALLVLLQIASIMLGAAQASLLGGVVLGV
ncbi:YggT family protein [Ottowia thiooxydans]|uniref:YggT family protein n=1 Tax=Ottowia thiooxydans TaxID=219182 RepID=UPI0004175CCB|nr:YggT family protein [Ottowia thiooxydans]